MLEGNRRRRTSMPGDSSSRGWMGFLVIAVLAARWHLRMAPSQQGETKSRITLWPKYLMKVVVEQRGPDLIRRGIRVPLRFLVVVSN